MQSPITMEPWLSPLSHELYSNVQGFISFLERSKNKFKPGSNEEREISSKLQQLKEWKSVAEQIFRSTTSIGLKATSGLERQIMQRSAKRLCFLDNIKMESEDFEIFSSTLAGSGKPVKVLALKAGNIEIQRHVPQFKMNNRFAPSFEEESEEESKASEAIFYNINNQTSSAFVPEDFEMLSNGELRSGFIFNKCLRRVSHKFESRDIFTACRCYFEGTEGGRVVKVNWNERYIIKRVGKLQEGPGHELYNHKVKREFKAHNLLTSLNHNNINKLVHYFEDDSNIYTVSESAGPTDLLDLVSDYAGKFKRGFSEDIVQKLFKDVVGALTVVHNLGIAHRDISLENLVLNNYGLSMGQQEKVEIIDWGHCIGVGADGQVAYEGALGKVRYMAPELVFGAEENLERYDAMKTDVFAFGVSLFTLLTGTMPFSRVDDGRAALLKISAEELIKKNNIGRRKRCESITELSDAAKDLLNRTLKWNPEERASMSEILEHPFFKQ